MGLEDLGHKGFIYRLLRGFLITALYECSQGLRLLGLIGFRGVELLV